MFRLPEPVSRARSGPGGNPGNLSVVTTDEPSDDQDGNGIGAGVSSHDETLIVAAQNGDLSAFNEIVRRHERAVFGVCKRLLGDVANAEDATQDTFIRAWRAIHSFRGGIVRPWLLRIATNRAYDLLRARARRPARSLDAEPFEIEPEWTSLATQGDSPESYAARSELSSVLERALADLPDNQRLAIILSDIEGYGYEEIAVITDVATGTVKSRISRGRSRLRDALQEDDKHRELFERFVRLTSQDERVGEA
jgi:RNA polymerase sigma-70 factor (ECF subfamily)